MARRLQDLRRSRPVLWAIILFVGWSAATQLGLLLLVIQKDMLATYHACNARLATAALKALGFDVLNVGAAIYSERASIVVERGCDGLQPCAFLAIAILVSPASWRSRLIGALAGVPILLLLNLVRIGSLLVLRGWPRLFELAHQAMWPLLIVLASLLLWVGWARRSLRVRTS